MGEVMQLDKELFSKIDYNNLRILAKYLRENVSDKQFDMENYRADSDLDRINNFDNLRSCGTVGCDAVWLSGAETAYKIATRPKTPDGVTTNWRGKHVYIHAAMRRWVDLS